MTCAIGNGKKVIGLHGIARTSRGVGMSLWRKLQIDVEEKNYHTITERTLSKSKTAVPVFLLQM
jgi:hypothetical protein